MACFFWAVCCPGLWSLPLCFFFSPFLGCFLFLKFGRVSSVTCIRNTKCLSFFLGQVHSFLFAHFTLPNCEVHITVTLFLAILSSSSFLFANSASSNCKVHIAQVNFSGLPKLVGRRLTKHRACHPRHKQFPRKTQSPTSSPTAT